MGDNKEPSGNAAGNAGVRSVFWHKEENFQTTAQWSLVQEEYEVRDLFGWRGDERSVGWADVYNRLERAKASTLARLRVGRSVGHGISKRPIAAAPFLCKMLREDDDDNYIPAGIVRAVADISHDQLHISLSPFYIYRVR